MGVVDFRAAIGGPEMMGVGRDRVAFHDGGRPWIDRSGKGEEKTAAAQPHLVDFERNFFLPVEPLERGW